MRKLLLAGFAAFALAAIAAPHANLRIADAEGGTAYNLADAEGGTEFQNAEADTGHVLTVADAEGGTVARVS